MENSPSGDLPDDPAMHCSFCDTPHFLVRKLIAGPGVFICDECVDVCNTIIQEATLQDAPSPAARVQAMAQIAREATRKLELLAEWSTDMERAADAGTEEFPTGGDTRH